MASSTKCYKYALASAWLRGALGAELLFHAFFFFNLQFQEERLFACANNLVPMQTVIDETIEYTKQRVAFGKPLLNNQVIHFRFAELETEVWRYVL